MLYINSIVYNSISQMGRGIFMQNRRDSRYDFCTVGHFSESSQHLKYFSINDQSMVPMLLYPE